MADKLVLKVGGNTISAFLSYRVEADLYQAAGAWELELDPTADLRVRGGQECTLEINDERVLTGVVDKVTTGYQKGTRRLTVSGRDVLGMAVDHCTQSFVTISNKTLKTLAKTLLRGVPILEKSTVEYSPECSSIQSTENEVQVEPGQSVFDVLRAAAAARGVVFWAKADGTLVFGRPKAKGDARYKLRVREGSVDGPVTEATLVQDSTRHFARIVVVGQQQDSGDGDVDVNVEAVVTDSDAPLAKTLVVVHNSDSQTPGAFGRALREQQRAAARAIEYSVSGHTLNGVPWQIGELVYVWDDYLGVPGETFLIYSRSFEMTKSQGCYTRLKLGRPGLVA